MTKPLLRDRCVKAASRAITRHAGWVLSGAIVFGAICWSFLPRLSLRPDVDDFVIDNDPAFLLRDEIRDLFPNSEFLVLAFQDDQLFSKEKLKILKNVTEQVEALESVRDVKSLANITDMVGTDDAFSVGPFMEKVPSAANELAALKIRAVENPLYRDQLISRDGRTAAIVVFTRTEHTNASARRDLIQSIHAITNPYTARGVTFHLAGWPVTNHFLADYMNRDLVRFLPITFMLVTLTIWIVFKNVRLLVLAVIGIIATVASTLGLTAALGVPLNNASAAVVPIVIALALSDLVHVFSHLSGDVLRTHPDRGSALAEVLNQVLFPCFLTSVNTAIGFLSLSMSGVPAIRSFGWLAGAGMMFEFIFTFGVVTPLLLLFPPETLYRDAEVHQNRWIPRAIRGIHGFVSKKPLWTFLFCLAALGWGAWQCRLIRSETNLPEWFHSSSPVRRDLEFIRENLAGVMSADIFIEADSVGALREPEALAAVDRLQKHVASVPGVDTATSLVDFFKEMNKSFHNEDPAYYRTPSTRRMADQFLLLYSADDLEDFVTPDFRKARISIRLHSNSTQVNEKVVKEVLRLIGETPIPGLRVRLGGDTVVDLRTAQHLVSAQVNNVFSAVVTIWLVMVLVLRSIGWASLFLVPNLFPILINFGIMGFSGITLDSGTSLIAAAAFGVIVDDTVHFFTRFKELREQGWAYFDAIRSVSFEKGEASTSSFFVMCVGFGVLSLSQFRPIMYFGILNVVVLLVGFVGDQFFLKSILVLWGKFRRQPNDLSTEKTLI